MTTHHPRQFPIILITGTPGTGKTLHSQLVQQEMSESEIPMKHLNIGDVVKEQGFHEGWDEEWKCWIVDEERLLDYLEGVVNPENGPSQTGFILDHHDPSLFPERWVDLAVVLICDNSVLHERLTARNYPPNKITENVTAEIMQTCLSETRESYDEEIIVELQSMGQVDNEVEENVERIVEWIGQWRKDRLEGKHD
ncbi:transcription initiation factor TFIID subunit 9/adenylate kinase [Kwoniella mangroviensis CBS 10435]|uniref:Adenylate kinase isoenzyme 6 homolog n=1 Tax=Kwoniella mangroviensis CBS 10435 TaxID=1331196 RepID=A0A1B9IRH8_9TREE|nr:transcription initiation factor TFIID subunit 9/adenylate kinase [Kwoniella mangroviensis CBS 8507]OCF58138.1 transcription initiation factor TFIID subunit 9/adenylate kinase [Kwoniella mangroviensis CBS 10435]OCF68084.1 transcription initiation factor TFIID subunit 9/adenylate kinase [Kwoniella mangroviensis CBS 8507]OCF78142.1 transcription initiation factor TFIID subunit 9/adenylate kinase [Kwoniella mangroviensis CBS 8886]